MHTRPAGSTLGVCLVVATVSAAFAAGIRFQNALKGI